MDTIHRIVLPAMFGMETVNSFLIKGDRPTLIDCGENTQNSYDALKTGLQEHGLTFEDLDRVVITHSHVDHLGLGSRLAKEHGVSIHVSDLVYPWAVDVELSWNKYLAAVRSKVSEYVDDDVMQGIESMFFGMLSYVLETWHSVPREYVETFDHGSGTLDLGGRDWQVIHAPGHSDMQSVFFDTQSGEIFGADMLLRIAPTPMYEGGSDSGLVQLLASYDRMLALDITKVYPGHYEIFDDHRVKIDQQVKRIHSRVEECYQLIKSGHRTMIDIFNVMYSGRMNLPAMNMGWAYIDMLIQQGRVQKILQDDGKAAILLPTD